MYHSYRDFEEYILAVKTVALAYILISLAIENRKSKTDLRSNAHIHLTRHHTPHLEQRRTRPAFTVFTLSFPTPHTAGVFGDVEDEVGNTLDARGYNVLCTVEVYVGQSVRDLQRWFLSGDGVGQV
jgi:hypothetical protein